MVEQAARLQTFRYQAALDDEVAAGDIARSAASFAREADVDPGQRFTSDQAAARYYLDELFTQDARPALRSLVGPSRPEVMPELAFEDEYDLRPTETRLVRFRQLHDSVPVFGAKAIVELTPARDLVSAECRVDEVAGVEPVENLDRREALERVAAFTEATLEPDLVAPAHLNYFKGSSDGQERWHLVWVLPDLPVAPPEDEAPDDAPAVAGHGLGPRPQPRWTYLVDAHDGEIVYHFSQSPTLDIPTELQGLDEDEQPRQFWGRVDGDDWRLEDPLRRVATYDLAFADLAAQPMPEPPASAVGHEAADFGDSNRAAVTAHVHAAAVQDFFGSVLQRNGIDDQGMLLQSYVNCVYSQQEPAPALRNAFWWNRRMWFGQIDDGDRLVSLARHLDVMAHELTHGVVESTAGLVYRDQPGALNESFADILGVIVNNWYTAPDRHDPATWSWEIGAGLSQDGGPLRDLEDPTRRRQPAHMDDRYTGSQDHGGVHINSGIPNKAAHLLLTATDDEGNRVLTAEQVALLCYLALTRLTELAQFSDLREAVLEVARVLFRGAPDVPAKLAAIEDAYDAVGIT